MGVCENEGARAYMKYGSKTILFAVDDNADSVELARHFIDENKLTFDQVKIIRRAGMICVEVR